MIWDLIVIGFFIVLAIWLFKIAWYIFLTVVVLIFTGVAWVVESIGKLIGRDR